MATKAYKFRIYPDPEQIVLLERTFGCTRYIYNKLLERSSQAYQAYKSDTSLPKPNPSGYSLVKLLPALKASPESIWLNEVSSVALQQKALDLGQAFTSFLKRKSSYPNFKNKRGHQSFRLTTVAFTLKASKFYIAKSATPIRVKWSRELPSQPTSCTITKTPTSKYYISFVCEYTPRKTTGQGIIGIDAGITDLATISNGITIANLRHYVRSQCRLARLQRQLSRKQKGSKNRNKARLRVATLHEHIANQRNDYLHKLTTKLVRDNQAIAIESLNVSGMVKNKKLAKHILDASWGKMRQYLTYKAIASQHCKIILTDPYYPSTQLCSVCGTKPKDKIKLGILSWTCSTCNTTHSRDVNAAKNLEILAHSQLHAARVSGSTASIILAPKYVQYH